MREILWLKESRHGRDKGSLQQFIHDLDGSAPAVRLTLLIERILYSPFMDDDHRLLLNGLGEGDRHNLIRIAVSMDSTDRTDDAGQYADLIGCWADCDFNGSSQPHGDMSGAGRAAGEGSRMLDLMAFAVRNEQWADMITDALASFVSKACRHDGMTVPEGDDHIWATPYPMRLQSLRTPRRCVCSIAGMIRAAFSLLYSTQTMVSPLSVTLSMIVGRCLDARSVLEPPMLGSGLYGKNRTPMDDLRAILDYMGDHGDDDSTAVIWPHTLSLFAAVPAPGERSIQDGDRMDDACMFALLTCPEFPDHMEDAMSRVRNVMARLRPMMQRENPRHSLHIPLLPMDTLSMMADETPERIAAMFGRLDESRAPLRCDGETIPHGEPAWERRIILDPEWETIVQRRGMMLSKGVAAADWNRHDTKGMLRIIRRCSTPTRADTSDPMRLLDEGGPAPKTDRGKVDDFILACMDTGQYDPASDMVALSALTVGTDRIMEAEHADDSGLTLRMLTTVSDLRRILNKISDGIPMDVVFQSLKPMIPSCMAPDGQSVTSDHVGQCIIHANDGCFSGRRLELYIDWRE